MAIKFENQPAKSSFEMTKPLLVLIITAGIFLFSLLTLVVYKGILSAQIESTQAKIKEIDKKRDIELEKEMKANLQTFEKVKNLLASHKNAKGVLTFIENNTYQGVNLSNFQANLTDNTLGFNISSVSPQNLIFQIAAFKVAIADPQSKRNAVSNVDVSGFSLNAQGIVTVHLKITLDPVITKF